MVKGQQSKWIGHLAVLAVYIIFGVNPNCSKAVVPDYITPEAYTALRLFVGAAGFWLISLFTPREKVARRDMWTIALGAVSLYGTLPKPCASSRPPTCRSSRPCPRWW